MKLMLCCDANHFLPSHMRSSVVCTRVIGSMIGTSTIHTFLAKMTDFPADSCCPPKPSTVLHTPSMSSEIFWGEEPMLRCAPKELANTRVLCQMSTVAG